MTIRVRAGQTWQHAKDYSPTNRITVYVYKVEDDRIHVVTADQVTGLPIEGGRKRSISVSHFRTSERTKDGSRWKTGYVLMSARTDPAELLDEAARAAEHAVAGHLHQKLCACAHWPHGCQRSDTPDRLTSEHWRLGLTAALEVLGIDPNTLGQA